MSYNNYSKDCGLTAPGVIQYFNRKYTITDLEGPGNPIRITNPKNNKSIDLNIVLIYRHPTSVVRIQQLGDKYDGQSLQLMDIELFISSDPNIKELHDATQQ